MNQNEFMLDRGFFGWLYKLLTPVEWVMTQVMTLFHKFLVFLGMPPVGLSWIFSIIFLVLMVHALILPMFIKQMKSMRRMQALQPKLQHIQQKYKGKTDAASKEAMSREMSKLYQDNNANPATSCLPMLIQGPVFMCMWYVLSAIPFIARGERAPLGAFDRATAENFSATTVFGLRVTTNFSGADTSGKIIIGIFIALMCVAMWYQQFNNMRKNLPRAQMQGQQYKIQQAMTWGFPIMYIFSGVTFPFAVLVYWLTNNVMNMLRSLWQVYALPTPGSPAAEEKEKRDYEHENARRKAAGEMSLEEEKLVKAREAAELRESRGFQRQQPQRKRRKK
jgi:YidC/Oxa1 family membrane protein insertase